MLRSCTHAGGAPLGGKVRLGQRRTEILDMAELRECASQQGGVRGSRQRHLRVGAGKDHALYSQGVQVRREAEFGSQEAHPVGARRIERNQDDIGRHRECQSGA